MDKQPKILDNIQNQVVDDLKQTIGKDSKISIIAASFSVYAFRSLKKELSKIKEFRFIFTGNSFAKEKEQKQVREFYIPRSPDNERSLYGNDFEIKLRNELNLQTIAKECAEWIKQKVKFKSNLSKELMRPFMVIENSDEPIAYNPFQEFTTTELGEDRGNNAYSSTTKLFAPVSRNLLDNFNSVWNDKDRLEDVTETVLENISNAYKENAPELIYYLAIYNIFKEFLEDINQDFMPNERTGFKESKIWNMLYSFQKDAVTGCISKLEKHNGCILADSVGLGKTFSALGIIKYYESRNKTALVLCPKRLSDNWNTYKSNYRNNPIAEDRLRYDVLYHTDLIREHGNSNGIDLSLINWENYDLVVIDESHNFRNGGEAYTDEEGNLKENRFYHLLHKVINKGVKTKVLMLSATPINTDFIDLKNQLVLACEGDTDNLSKTLNTQNPVDKIFQQAQNAFKSWSKLMSYERTTPKLLEMLHFDFFELLDSVTIARSRKHIERYYADDNIGKFPERLRPISLSPDLTDLPDISFNSIYNCIQKLNLQIYTPLQYVYPSQHYKYIKDSGHQWKNREMGRLYLMDTNLLKRLESSVYAFRLTLERMHDLISNTIENINSFEINHNSGNLDIEINPEDLDGDDENIDFVGKDLKISLEDMDYQSWRGKLLEDEQVLSELIDTISKITPQYDSKLIELMKHIANKIENPINTNNRKILLFSAFADTTEYLYENLKDTDGLEFAMVSGGAKKDKTTLKGIHNDFNEILTCFSSKSKQASVLFKNKYPGDIDILIATDCISEGQNLQDCDYLINYDIHWNPVRIIQRFGRIDRIGSQNDKIQLVNFWPNITLDKYINLKDRVRNRMKIVGIGSTGEDVLENIDNDLEYRKKQLEKIQEEVVDIEDMNNGISIMDLGLNEFHLDVQELLKKYGDAANMPHGIHAIAKANADNPQGVIFVLKNLNRNINIDKQNRLHPFYLLYINKTGETVVNHLNPKTLLDKFRFLCKNNTQPIKELVSVFNEETNNGKAMKPYSDLLGKAIQSIIQVKTEKEVDSLFSEGGTSALENKISGLNDFELIDFLIIN